MNYNSYKNFFSIVDSFINVLNEAIALYDASNFEVVAVNEKLLEILNIDRETFKKNPPLFFCFRPDEYNKDYVINILKNATKGNEENLHFFITKNDHTFKYKATIKIINNEYNLLIVTILEEIPINDIFNALVESLDSLIYVCSRDHTLEYLSPKLVELVGENRIGEKCYKVLHKFDNICPWCKDKNVFNGEKKIWEIKNPKDNRWYKVLNYPIKHEEGTFSKLMVITDITESKKVQEPQKNDRLQLLALMAGGMAHDFNNLLTGILGYISLLKLPVVSYDDFKKYIENAEEGCKKARRLVNQLLSFSKGMPLNKEKINLKNLFQEIMGFILSGKPYTFELNIPDDTWEIYADKIQMEQIIQNLTINAVHAMPRGGNITITCENLEIKNYYEYNLSPGKYVKISFKDTGKGIPKGMLEKIFDPFFTTKKDGSGLGLAIIQEIVRKHEGLIKVESEVNKGTEFIIYLPVSMESSTFTLDNFIPEKIKEAHVLIMDDDPMILALCREMIIKMGHRAEIARDGNKALELIETSKKNRDPYDVLITDMIVVDGLGGVELIKKAKEKLPEIKIIIASAYCEDFNNNEEIKDKVEIFLKKPYTYEELNRAVSRLIS